MAQSARLKKQTINASMVDTVNNHFDLHVLEEQERFVGIKDVITEVMKIQNEITLFGKQMGAIEQRVHNEDANTVLREIVRNQGDIKKMA